MQRVLAITLLLGLAVVPLSAQHRGGGGHAAMRGPSFSVGVRGGYYGGPRYSFGAHYSGHHYAPHYYGRYYGPRYYPRYSWGVGFYYGWPYYGSYYPSYSYPYVTYATPSYPAVYDTDPTASQDRQQLSNDVNNLRDEVRDLRDSNDQLRYELEKRRVPGEAPRSQSRPPGNYPAPPVATPAQDVPATVFVFKNGLQLDAHNYAIVGSTLWVLSPQRALKYSIDQIDYEATRKANADRGIEIALPAPASASPKSPNRSPSGLRGD